MTYIFDYIILLKYSIFGKKNQVLNKKIIIKNLIYILFKIKKQ